LEDEQKYISPGIILPLETSSWVDFRMEATFSLPKADLPFSATFLSISPTATFSAIVGNAQSVVAGTTMTLATFTIVNSGSYISGFQCSGDTDGVYAIYLNGILSMRVTANIIDPNPLVPFPNQWPLSIGTTISIQVTNTGDSTANYTAVTFGSF